MTSSINPPIPTPGSLQNLDKDFRTTLTQAYKEYGPVFKIKMRGREIIVLAGIEANKFASKNDGKVWRTWEVTQILNVPLDVEKTVISLDGKSHREMRKVLRKSLARTYLDKHIDCAYQVLIEDLQNLKKGQSFSVIHWIQALVVEQLSRLVVQSTSRPFFNDISCFTRTVLMAMVTPDKSAIMFENPEYLSAKDNLFKLADTLIANHRYNPPGPHRTPDLIDDMIDAQKQDPESWSYNDIRAGTMNSFLAGLDTAGGTLSFILYQLYKHPEILKRVQNEVDELFAQGFPSLDALGKAPTLHNTVLETLRLHPIAAMITRFSTQDFEFAGYTIPKNQVIAIGTTVAHGLDDTYTDPERFDPDRFGPDRAEHRKAGAFHPFGLGPHTCLGSGLAEYLLLVNVATIIHYVDLYLDPQYQLEVAHVPAPQADTSFHLQMNGIRHSLSSKL